MNVSGPKLVSAYKSWLAREGAGSPTLLHPTSPASLRAKRKAGGGADLDRPALNLILMHDELQLEPGRLQLRRGDAGLSSRGHNGVKSVVNTLVKGGLLSAGGGATKSKGGVGAVTKEVSPILMRVGVGIGRPGSREPGAVADYVLQEMSGSAYKKTCAQTDNLVEMLETMMSRMAT